MYKDAVIIIIIIVIIIIIKTSYHVVEISHVAALEKDKYLDIFKNLGLKYSYDILKFRTTV